MGGKDSNPMDLTDPRELYPTLVTPIAKLITTIPGSESTRVQRDITFVSISSRGHMDHCSCFGFGEQQVEWY